MKYRILCLFDGTYLAKFPIHKSYGLCHESDNIWAGIERHATFYSYNEAVIALTDLCRRNVQFKIDGIEFPLSEKTLSIYFEIVVS